MIESPKKVIERIDADLDLLLSKPRLWGDDESVEMQFLTLMALRQFIVKGDDKEPVKSGRGDDVMKPYFAVLQKHFGTWFQPACYLLNRGLRMTSDDKTKKLCEILQEARQAIVSEAK